MRWWDDGPTPLPQAWFRWSGGPSSPAVMLTSLSGDPVDVPTLTAPAGAPLPEVDGHGQPSVDLAGEASGVLDGLFELADAAQILGMATCQHLQRVADTDLVGRCRLLLRHLWGEQRAWRLRRAPRYELQIRLPALAGLTHLEGLERCLRATFGADDCDARSGVNRRAEPRVGVHCRLDWQRAPADGAALELASPLQASPAGVPPAGNLSAGPPVIGPLPFVAPRLVIEFERRATERARWLGFERWQAGRPQRASGGAGIALARTIARCYLPPHVPCVIQTPEDGYQHDTDGRRGAMKPA